MQQSDTFGDLLLWPRAVSLPRAWTRWCRSRVEAVLMRFLLVVPMEAEVRLIVTAQG